MNADSFRAHSLSDLKEKLKARPSASLAIFFSHVSHGPMEISNLLRRHGVGQVLGTSSAGEIENGTLEEKTIVVMLLDLPDDSFEVIHIPKATGDSREAGRVLGRQAGEMVERPGFILMFGLDTHGEKLIEGIESVVGKDCPIYGGMASDDSDLMQPMVICNDEMHADSIVGVVLDRERIRIHGMAINGWEPIGVAHTITSAKYNEIFTINNKPALDVFINFFGFYENPNETPDEEDVAAMVNAQYPLQVQRDGDVVMRAPLKANRESRSLVMAGPVREGETFRFSISPGFEVIEETLRGFKALHDVMPEPEALILFSCKARHWSFGPLVEEEIEGLAKFWPQPMIGFFSYGEIGQSPSGRTLFLNETCSLIGLSEVASEPEAGT